MHEQKSPRTTNTAHVDDGPRDGVPFSLTSAKAARFRGSTKADSDRITNVDHKCNNAIYFIVPD